MSTPHELQRVIAVATDAKPLIDLGVDPQQLMVVDALDEGIVDGLGTKDLLFFEGSLPERWIVALCHSKVSPFLLIEKCTKELSLTLTFHGMKFLSFDESTKISLEQIGPGRSLAFWDHAQRPVVEGIQNDALHEHLFGPSRALSNPSSARVLQEYGIATLPTALGQSAHHAGVLAKEIGFPVCVRYASPDKRAWDDPNVIRHAHNLSQVKQSFHELSQAFAGERALGCEILPLLEEGLQLSLECTRVGPRCVRASFSVVGDETKAHNATLYLPAPPSVFEALAAHFGSHAARAIEELLDRSAAMLFDFPDAIQSVRYQPLRLFGETLFVEDSSIKVSDFFERMLAAE